MADTFCVSMLVTPVVTNWKPEYLLTEGTSLYLIQLDNKFGQNLFVKDIQSLLI